MKLLTFAVILFIATAGFSQVTTNGSIKVSANPEDILNLFKSKKKNKRAEDSTQSLNNKQFQAGEMGLNDIINYAVDGFTSIKGRLTSQDDYGTSGSMYLATYCLKGAAKCILNFSDFDKAFKARFGNSSIGWEEASAGFDSLYAMIKNEKLVWGKTKEGFGFDNGSGKMAQFSVDINNEGAEKYKDIEIKIETIYINENEYQLVLSVIDKK